MTTHDDLFNELNQHREQTSEVLFDWQARQDDPRDRPSGVARRTVKTSEVLEGINIGLRMERIKGHSDETWELGMLHLAC